MDKNGKIRAATLIGGLTLALLPGAAFADVVTYNASLASPPGVYFGTGNSNSGFTVDTANDVEIGLSAIERFIAPITPSGNVYNVTLGDVASPHTGSAWGVTFSINLQQGGGSLTLSGIDAVLTVTDVGTGFSHAFPGFLAALTGNTCYNGAVAACTNAADYGVQNSEPGSLFASIGDTNFNDHIGDTYDITLAVYGCSTPGCVSNLLASDTIQVDAVPEPNVLATFGVALAGLGLLYHRRREGRNGA